MALESILIVISNMVLFKHLKVCGQGVLAIVVSLKELDLGFVL